MQWKLDMRMRYTITQGDTFIQVLISIVTIDIFLISVSILITNQKSSINYKSQKLEYFTRIRYTYFFIY